MNTLSEEMVVQTMDELDSPNTDSSLKVDTSQIQKVEQPSKTEVVETAADKTKAKPEGEAKVGTATTEDTKEEGFVIDRNSIPEELRPHLDHLNRSYVKTVQKQAAKYVPRISELEKENKSLLEENQLLRSTTDSSSQEAIAKAREEMLSITQNDHISQEERQFLELDTRFVEESPDYDPDLRNYVVSVVEKKADEYAQEKGSVIGFSYVQESKRVLEAWDERLKKATIPKVVEKTQHAISKIGESKKRNPDGRFSPNAKSIGKISVNEAFDEAWEEMGNN